MYSKELAILKTAITNEHESRQFYLLAAEKLPEDMKQLFLMLAGEEAKHEEWLKSVYRQLMRKNPPLVETEPLPLKTLSHGFFRMECLKNAGSLELLALRIGVLLEMAAVEYYRTATIHTEILPVRELYEILFEWELAHQRKLEEAYDFAKEEWWDRQGLSEDWPQL